MICRTFFDLSHFIPLLFRFHPTAVPLLSRFHSACVSLVSRFRFAKFLPPDVKLKNFFILFSENINIFITADPYFAMVFIFR